jgi:hypothetical protein
MGAVLLNMLGKHIDGILIDFYSMKERVENGGKEDMCLFIQLHHDIHIR